MEMCYLEYYLGANISLTVYLVYIQLRVGSTTQLYPSLAFLSIFFLCWLNKGDEFNSNHVIFAVISTVTVASSPGTPFDPHFQIKIFVLREKCTNNFPMC